MKSLLALYSKEDYLIAIQHFTERFKPRLIAMATTDTDLSVRVAVIQVLCAIDKASLLEEDQRSTLSVLIFDEEARVRKAISGFIKNIWDETVKERLVGRDGADEEEDEDSQSRKYAGAKALSSLLVSWERGLARRDNSNTTQTNESGSSSHTPTAETLALLGALQKGRTALAVEALWDEVDSVSDWQALLDILLLDHSGSGSGKRISDDVDVDDVENSNRGKKGKQPMKGKGSSKGKGKATADSGSGEVDEAWRLEEDEESALVEILSASLQKTLADEGKKGVSEEYLPFSQFLLLTVPTFCSGRSRVRSSRYNTGPDQSLASAFR